MNRQELIARIKQHVAACSSGQQKLTIRRLWELAEGVITAWTVDLDDQEAYVIYFDRLRLEASGKGASDISRRDGLLPEDTGLIQSKWGDRGLWGADNTARESLCAKPGQPPIKWRDPAVRLVHLPG